MDDVEDGVELALLEGRREVDLVGVRGRRGTAVVVVVATSVIVFSPDATSRPQSPRGSTRLPEWSLNSPCFL